MKHGTSARLVLVAAVVAAVGCHASIDDGDPPSLSKVSPAALSSSDAWRLFDRSVESSYTPGAEPLRITFARVTRQAY